MQEPIEGVFDGQNMVGADQKIYPVPTNYASKSKLIEGDRLKLTILDNGQFLFKQIRPVKNKHIIGRLVRSVDDRFYEIIAEGQKYNVLSSSVTYFKIREGEEVVVVVPVSPDAHWAAIENVVRKNNDIDQEL